MVNVKIVHNLRSGMKVELDVKIPLVQIIRSFPRWANARDALHTRKCTKKQIPVEAQIVESGRNFYQMEHATGAQRTRLQQARRENKCTIMKVVMKVVARLNSLQIRVPNSLISFSSQELILRIALEQESTRGLSMSESETSTSATGSTPCLTNGFLIINVAIAKHTH